MSELRQIACANFANTQTDHRECKGISEKRGLYAIGRLVTTRYLHANSRADI
ncbi:MAG: hypothetical protein H8D26_07580 [Methanomicrobia archaeon]|nr:hypothetical protein [Methanomicrobia archaeon]